MNGDLRKDMVAKTNDYDARHTPEAATAKAKDLVIEVREIGAGRYRHMGQVTRYIVMVKFEIVRIAEIFPVAYTFSAEIQENDETGAFEYVTANEGTVF